VEDKFCTQGEYGKLTNDQKSKLAWLRSQCDDGDNENSNTTRSVSSMSGDDFKELMDQRISAAMTTPGTSTPDTNNRALVRTDIAPSWQLQPHLLSTTVQELRPPKQKLADSFLSLINLRLSAVSIKENNRTDFDSHADSPLVGESAYIIHYMGDIEDVLPLSDELGKCSNVPVVQAAVAYDCPMTGNTTILIIHNAPYIKTMKINLTPPIMLRMHGWQVDECPKSLL